jgi:hypothetical protein
VRKGPFRSGARTKPTKIAPFSQALLAPAAHLLVEGRYIAFYILFGVYFSKPVFLKLEARPVKHCYSTSHLVFFFNALALGLGMELYVPVLYGTVAEEVLTEAEAPGRV